MTSSQTRIAKAQVTHTRDFLGVWDNVICVTFLDSTKSTHVTIFEIVSLYLGSFRYRFGSLIHDVRKMTLIPLIPKQKK